MIITGETKSRLSELKKYKVTTVFTEKYHGNGTVNTDGVVFNQSDPEQEIVYFLGGVKYIDDVTDNVTRYEFTALGTDSPHFIQPPVDKDYIETPIYKDPTKENIISKPKIQDSVFIVRQEISAFDRNYRLQFINNLNDLTTYLGGNYYDIINNT
ncbi:MAG: hypothetical protein ACOC22_00250 [bacterium]